MLLDLSSWNDSSLSNVIEQTNRGDNIQKIFYELCAAAMKNTIPTSVISDLITNEHFTCTQETIDILADVFWAFGLDTKSKAAAAERKTLVSIIRPILDREGSLLTTELCQERFGGDLLTDLKLVKSEDMFRKRMIRYNTKNIYMQQKFNLFQEESEGFSKLLDLLTRSTLPIVDLKAHFTCLLGQFDVDPNRAFDVVLNVMESSEKKALYLVHLLDPVSSDCLANLLGFKFQQFADTETPSGLLNVTALLLDQKRISLSEIYPHLSLDDETMHSNYKQFADSIESLAKSLRMVSLDEKQKHSKDVIRSTSDLTAIRDDSYEKNQKLQLLATMARFGNWNLVETFSHHIEPIRVASYQPIAQALCSRAAAIIRSLFKSTMNLDLVSVPKETYYVDEVKSFEELPSKLFPVLHLLGPYVHVDGGVYKDILTLIYASLKEDAKPTTEYTRLLEDVLENVLLPGLSCIHAKPRIAERMWNVLSKFPYTSRFRLYGHWNLSYDKDPLLLYMKNKTIKETKAIHKRITANSIEKYGDLISEVADGNPLVILKEIISTVQSYENQIEPFAGALCVKDSKNVEPLLTSLSVDVLSYLIVVAASSEQERMSGDGHHMEGWIYNLAVFCGLVSANLQIDLTSILQYTYNQMKNFNVVDLVFLRLLLEKMSGREVITKLTKPQMVGMSGGDVLKMEVFVKDHLEFKPSRLRLTKALYENHLIVPFLLMISQLLPKIIFDSDSSLFPHLKLLNKAVDNCHSTLLLLIDFLHMSIPAKNLIETLPSMRTFLCDHHTQPAIVFQIFRPLLPYVVRDSSRKKHLKLAKTENGVDTESDGAEPTESLLEVVEEFLGKPEYKNLAKFYSFFWSFSLPDLKVPKELYAKRIAHHKKQMQNKSQDQSTDLKKPHQALIGKLEAELAKQEDNHEQFMERFTAENGSWFTTIEHAQNVAPLALQLCIFPRCVNSAEDAKYCAKFVALMHNKGVPIFNTLLHINKVVVSLECMMFSFTQNEATHFGTFLFETLKMMAKWNDDKEFFEKQKSLPGFRAEIGTSKQAGHNDIKLIFKRLNVKLVHAFKACLISSEYLMIRNALVILSIVADVFPTEECAPNLEKYITDIVDNDTRPDLVSLAERTRDIIRHHLNRFNEVLREATAKNESEKSSSTPAKSDSSSASGSKKSEKKKQNSSVVAPPSVSGSKRSRIDDGESSRRARDSPSRAPSSQPPRKSSRGNDNHEPAPKDQRKESNTSDRYRDDSSTSSRSDRSTKDTKRSRRRSPDQYKQTQQQQQTQQQGSRGGRGGDRAPGQDQSKYKDTNQGEPTNRQSNQQHKRRNQRNGDFVAPPRRDSDRKRRN